MAEARSIDTFVVAPDERASDLSRLTAAIDRSSIAALKPNMGALGAARVGVDAGRSAARASGEHADSWARQDDDVDIEILEWIVSHARGKRRLTRSSH